MDGCNKPQARSERSLVLGSFSRSSVHCRGKFHCIHLLYWKFLLLCLLVNYFNLLNIFSTKYIEKIQYIYTLYKRKPSRSITRNLVSVPALAMPTVRPEAPHRLHHQRHGCPFWRKQLLPVKFHVGGYR